MPVYEYKARDRTGKLIVACRANVGVHDQSIQTVFAQRVTDGGRGADQGELNPSFGARFLQLEQHVHGGQIKSGDIVEVDHEILDRRNRDEVRRRHPLHGDRFSEPAA